MSNFTTFRASYLECSRDTEASTLIMDKGEFKLTGLNGDPPGKITKIKHKRHLAPNEDTKFHIFGDTSNVNSGVTNNKGDLKSLDQENTQPPSTTSEEEANRESHPRYPRGGNRRNMHHPL